MDVDARTIGLATFSRRFSLLLDLGMPLVQILTTIESDGPEPYASLAREIGAELLDGHPISESMLRRPDAFPPFYARLVRVGEIGGILDVALACLADMTEERWLACVSGPGGHGDWLWAPEHSTALGRFAELTATQQAFALMAFAWSLGVMLGAGVPCALALETAADLLPLAERNAIRLVAAGDLQHGLASPLESAGFLPRTLIESVRLADEPGSLDRVLERLADCYRHEYRCRLARC
ncbi:MAG: hypothetical protein FJX72_11220 [Armatimonadetes bacterium]|nr:hypothetical protein [Armatimonadota bacterium]